MSEAKPQEASAPSGKRGGDLLVVDIGKKQKRKRIRQLRKGRGRLFDRINDVVDDLREEGAIDENATPVVIVVREKARRNSFKW